MNGSQSPLAVACIAQNIIKNIDAAPNYLEIFIRWQDVVGERIASICVPHKVINMGNDKILVLKTIKGRGLQIQHETLGILNSVNKFLKKRTFSQMRVFQIEAIEF
ncbi:MAG: DciA family protein [Holosporaceae bacterium]|jgi:hypothetical protein|nr:DciA family protein [Holosporaceae bacterium]